MLTVFKFLDMPNSENSLTQLFFLMFQVFGEASHVTSFPVLKMKTVF